MHERNTDNWWSRVFTEAASNISIEKSSGVNSKNDIKIQLLDTENGVELTNKSYSLIKLKKQNATLKYGSFLKSSTLLANEEKKDDKAISIADFEIKPTTMLSDDELFRICGGRTAHKSARHGLKLEGKLRRVAEQEKEFLEKFKRVEKSTNTNDPCSRTKPTSFLLNSSTESCQEVNNLPVEDESKDYTNISVSKRKRKREKQTSAELASKILIMDLSGAAKPCSSSALDTIETKEEGRKKKKKKKHQEHLEEDDTMSEKRSSTKKKKSKHHGKQTFVKRIALVGGSDDDVLLNEKKSDLNSDEEKNAVGPHKKKKRSKKNSKSKRKKENRKILDIFEKQLNLSDVQT